MIFGRKVFEAMNRQIDLMLHEGDLKAFGESLWVLEPEPGQEIWVFDSVLGVAALNADREGA